MNELFLIYLQLVRYRTLQFAKSGLPDAVTKCLLVLSADQGWESLWMTVENVRVELWWSCRVPDTRS